MRHSNKSTSRLIRVCISSVVSFTLLIASIPVSSFAVVSPPPLNHSIVQIIHRMLYTLFPRPLFVGTLMSGSLDAGMPDRGDEKVSMATSAWTNLVVNLQTGNHLVSLDIISLPTASGLPLSVQLIHNSRNASLDVGVGKGWMTNLHTCVKEDSQTGDITYMDPLNSTFLNKDNGL